MEYDQQKTVLTKSTYKIDDFLQILSNGKKVFNFHEFEKTPFKFILLITQRGATGKTLNFKKYAVQKWMENGYKSIFIKNTGNLLTSAKRKFKQDIITKPFVQKNMSNDEFKIWKAAKMIGEQKDNSIGMFIPKEFTKSGEREEIIHLLKIVDAEAEKDSRERVNSVFWDEINVNSKKSAVDLFSSLTHTLEDVVDDSDYDSPLFIFAGNNKSLNNEVIRCMGVTHLEHEVTEVRTEDGFPILLVIAPQFSDEDIQQIEIKNRDSHIYQMSKVFGKFQHAYLNTSLNDDVNFVKRYIGTEEVRYLKEYCYIYTRGTYISISENLIDKTLHASIIPSKHVNKNKLLRLEKKDIIETAPFNIWIKKDLEKYISASKMTFENIISRAILIKAIIS